MSQKYSEHALFSVFLLFFAVSVAQETSVQGTIIDEVTSKPIPDAEIGLLNQNITQSDADGFFILKNQDIPFGEQVLTISKEGYITKRLPVVISEGISLDLDIINLKLDVADEVHRMGTIILSDIELDEDEGGMDNVSGLLQATNDVFLNAAAYDFSATFFRPRGLDSDQSKVLINGIEMNKIFNGRPQWSNWGGLNDVQRNQVFARNFTASDYDFGGLSGTTNIIMRASQYREGGRVSYASANKSYRGRIMGHYNSGLLNNGWAYSVSAGRRFASEGFVEGTSYDANSFFLSVEKKFNDRHSLNFTGFYTPNTRGKSSPNSDEVIGLRGITYNSYWGLQNGEIRNSRLKIVKEPVFMINHNYSISEKTTLNTNAAFQTGYTGNSRIDYGGTRLQSGPNGEEVYIGGGSNPDPSYYQYLPSYYLRNPTNPNYEGAYLAQQEFMDNGQLNWDALYAANLNLVAQGGNSVYVLYEDRNADDEFSVNSILTSEVTEQISLNASVSYKNLQSRNYATITDFLGGNGYLDVDVFAEDADDAQSDLQNRNRIVGEGDKFKYDFELNANVIEAFAQAQFSYNKLKFFVAVEQSATQYQRTGFFQNGNFPESSLGKSEQLNFTNFSSKAGLNYKLFGNHFVEMSVAQISKAPNLRNSFSNSRQNNDVVAGLESENNFAADVSYLFRSAKMNIRLTGFAAYLNDATEIGFYYADGISGIEAQNTTTAFVQEVLTGIDKRHIGVEMGAESQVTSTIKLKAAASVGSYTYSSNPFLYLTSDDFNEPLIIGPSHLKNYKVAGGPQTAAQIGFEYRDPSFWWFSTTFNYFSNAYVDPSPLMRTRNFYQDPVDGLPFNDYNEDEARVLLKQEKFDPYTLVNLVGGKTWIVKNRYIGFFATINNIFNTRYKTGGFEQSRNANFRTLKEDNARDKPLFAPKYWFGYGTTYYVNVYVRF